MEVALAVTNFFWSVGSGDGAGRGDVVAGHGLDHDLASSIVSIGVTALVSRYVAPASRIGRSFCPAGPVLGVILADC